MKRTGKVLIAVAASLLLIVVLYFVVCSLMTGVFYSRFMGPAEKEFGIPGLTDGFVPQGLARCEALDCWLCCGYSDSGEASGIYLIDGDGKATAFISLKRPNGEVYTGHAGGISSSGDMIWISNAKKMFYLSAETLRSAADGDGWATFAGYVEVGVNASFTFADESYVWVGEYHKDDDYQTADGNHLTCPDGTEHGALIYGYPLDAATPFGFAVRPSVVLSVRDIVQGFCVTATGSYVLSCSSGLDDSHLYVYRASGEADGTLSYAGSELPLYYLDSSRITDTVRMPHMSEDLDYVDGRVYVGFEACAAKYGAGLLPWSLRSVYSYPVN